MNFASVTLSNKSSYQMQQTQYQGENQGENQGQNQNYLFSSGNNVSNNMPNNKVPQPRNANSPLALNKKINLEEQTYDYNKYFFI